MYKAHICLACPKSISGECIIPMMTCPLSEPSARHHRLHLGAPYDKHLYVLPVRILNHSLAL